MYNQINRFFFGILGSRMYDINTLCDIQFHDLCFFEILSMRISLFIFE